MDQNFHDVTIVDMGDVPESSISIPELSTLTQQWPPAVISHMGWRQQELEWMRAAAKQHFHQSRPSSCVYCGIWIKCDIYRHVARSIWTWRSCGGAQYRGTPCGRAHPKTAWITFEGRMMFCGNSSWPAWNTFFRHGRGGSRIFSQGGSVEHRHIATETPQASQGKVRRGVWGASPKKIWNMKCSRSDSEPT